MICVPMEDRQRVAGKKVIDEHFDDERMDRIYPNAKPR